MLDNRLTHVVAVARAGSFTAAAGAVGVTQSAITRSIADLERQVGYAIFVRTARGALLTEKGRDFAERAQKLLEDTKDLLETPQTGADAYAGILRIGVCPASMEFRLIEPLATLLKRHPSVRVDVSGANVERIVQQLRNGSVDVAVGFDAAFADWPDLRRQAIFNENPGQLFVRRGHPVLENRKATLKHLAKYDFVSPSDSRPYGAIIRALYEDQGIDWRQHIHVVDFFPIVKRIVATTDAIGVMIAGYADRSASFRNQFVVLDAQNPFSAAAALCCAVRARWEARPAARAFMTILQGARSARPNPA
ncbi:MAG TPA: LysR family transcriptional regulator [Vitreimonas sp.]|jgi:DNA-binding transcriptional LysR family regulator|nr:LysR family transcriptional regulator [Vitreimonas sp.]